MTKNVLILSVKKRSYISKFIPFKSHQKKSNLKSAVVEDSWPSWPVPQIEPDEAFSRGVTDIFSSNVYVVFLNTVQSHKMPEYMLCADSVGLAFQTTLESRNSKPVAAFDFDNTAHVFVPKNIPHTQNDCNTHMHVWTHKRTQSSWSVVPLGPGFGDDCN